LKSKSFSAAIFLAVGVSIFAGKIFACGPDFPNNLLDAGDNAVLQPPVASFQCELERMKLVTTSTRAVPLADGQNFNDQSSAAEMSDLAAVLNREKISTELATVIMQAHLAERMKLNAFLKAQDEWSHFHSGIYDTNLVEQPNTNPPPVFPAVVVTPGLPREFAEYFEGVLAWQKHDGFDASLVWKRLLELPPSERHFKSTWAAFMIGKYCDDADDVTKTLDDQIRQSEDEAVKYFEQVRALAANGFADSLGLATASLGEEARIFLHRNDCEHAIELYLQQFTAGDGSAINSLRFAAAHALDATNSTPAQLKMLALNPRTRRVITAYLISRNPYTDLREAETDPQARQFFDRTTVWLKAVESANVKDVESAEQLALAAYQAGDMDAAQRWIKRTHDSAVAKWLQAKLFMRAGKISEAAELLAKVSRQFPQEFPASNTPASFAQSLFVDIEPVWGDRIAVGRQAFGELGVLHLARREYAEALDALLRSGYWMDAAYVAERVLTTEELKKYVDSNWPVLSDGKKDLEIRAGDFPSEPGFMPREEIRWLLARRIARETGGDLARNYFPENYAEAYGQLLSSLSNGRDTNQPAEMRAKNLFAAAVMTRTNGMELFGTELEPDWAISSGNYDLGFGYWKDRATNFADIKINLASDDEIGRALRHGVEPEKRFHYRYQAAELAWEAAELMPDNSDDTARVLCTAGTWLKDRDPQAADKFYKALVRRCRKTILGDEADKIRWFPAQPQSGERPRLETIEITPELTSMTWSNYEGVFSEEFPVPGRQYSVHEVEDVFIIARAVQRLGYPMTVEQILQANPGLKRSLISEGRLIMIPKVPDESSEFDATNSADVISETAVFSGTTYVVRAGDSATKIAKLTGVTVKAILDSNPDLDSKKIKVGQILAIPKAMETNSPSMPNATGAGN
jgi:LysM repeat protein